MKERPRCYGTMFPDLNHLKYNERCKGKAISAMVRSGGIGVQSRAVAVDWAEWEKCQACSFYRECYDLSMAKLVLTQALNQSS